MKAKAPSEHDWEKEYPTPIEERIVFRVLAICLPLIDKKSIEKAKAEVKSIIDTKEKEDESKDEIRDRGE